VDPEKAAFLDDAGDDPELDGSDGVALQVAFRDAIGQQIVDDDPPQVWRTAQRLLGGGMAAPAVWRQLVLAFGASVVAGADADDARFDRDGYLSSLDRLPLPSAERVIEVLVAAVRDRQPVSADEVDELVAAELGLPLDDPLTETLLDLVQDELLDEHEGPLAMLAPDLLVHVPSLVDGVVLTHRLTDGERESGTLLAADLPGFARIELRHEDDAVFEAVAEDCRSRWIGPPDWLQPYPAGALLAVRVAPDGQVALTVLDEEPELADELVAEVRAAYDAEVDEAWLPVTGEDLVLGVLARDRGAFTRPAPPLSELAAAAGLQEREERYAHEESVWRHAAAIDRARRMSDLLGPGPTALSALRVLDFLDGEPPDTADAREILHALADPQVFDVVLDELLGVGDLERPSGFDALIPTLLKAASRGNERAVAELLAAVACERDGAVLDAESHLREAVRADPGWPPAEDRLAWYEADRGDAAAATARWRRLGHTPVESQDLATAEGYVAAAGPEPGRNAPCWCGSGRKYKTCHRGRPAVAPLPDRVGWLCRKAVAYLQHRGGTFPAMMEFATARATDPEDLRSVMEAFEDPLVFDVALHEAGWFERFLADRGPLLPPDEAMLAQAWTLVDRSVYEVLDISAGHGLSVRDVRTGDRIEVRERSFSRQARVGELLCARVVPDGESHQLIGGLFRVPPGTEGPLLELLDRRDGFGLLSFVAAQSRPPTFVTTEGEPLLDCRAQLAVPDPLAARTELDRRYEPDGPGWVSYVEPEASDQRTVRAWLELDGDILGVRTLSARRLDAVLAELRAALPDARVDSDERRPTAPDAAAPPVGGPVDEAMREALMQLADRHERQWCEEHVPALGGRTPRQAAADPTRRDELARLIATFPEIDPASGMVGLRPTRLRELLGLTTQDR
jgi:hypothetical protein